MRPLNSFNGARLREAREARAITATSLSELIGKAVSSVSQYENGVNEPPPNVIARISEVLNVPPHFFTQPSASEDEPLLFWRSRTAALKTSRTSATRKYAWLRSIVGYLGGYVSFPSPNFMDIDPPADPAVIDQSYIEEAATKLRRFWGLGDGPISDVVQLVENNGGIVTRTEMGSTKLDAFSDWPAGEGHYFVVLSTDKDSAVRSRHDIAHELAHGLVHKNVPNKTRSKPNMHKLMEIQAEQFASAFLMPASTFPSEVYSATLDGLYNLKKRWRTSISSMIMRLTNLNILDEQAQRRLFIQMSRRGWRKREPLDNELSPEEPRLLRRAVDTLISSRTISPEELSHAVHLPVTDIERLLGLAPGHLRPEEGQAGPLLFDQAPLKISDYMIQ